MKKITLFTGYIITCFIFISCKENTTNYEGGFLEFTIDQAKEKKEILLSDWLEDCRMVTFENTDTALFRTWMVTISDNYILVRQHGGCYKLFNHQGDFLCDVGGYGSGPGEYTSTYDEIIDENEGKIYIAPFANYSRIRVYNLKGKLINEIDLQEGLNKPRLYMLSDNNLFLLHMAINYGNEYTASFLGMEFTKEGEMIQKITPRETDYVHPDNPFNNEIFAFGNTDHFSYFLTGKDTLMGYNSRLKTVEPLFHINMNGAEHSWILYNEIPHYYLANIFGGNKSGMLAVNKKTGTGEYIYLTNDYFGNMHGGGTFNKGWYFKMLEPEDLLEIIDGRLAESSCTEKDRKKLEELKKGINPKGNNIMLYGKLKK